jgi:hypothetical protein
MATAIYAFSLIYFNPQLVPAQKNRKIFKLLSLVMFIGGLLVVVAPIVYQ